MTDPFAKQPKDKRAPCLVGQLDEHLQRESSVNRHRIRCECGAFCKRRWLPYPALGTDPDWECKNCGART